MTDFERNPALVNGITLRCCRPSGFDPAYKEEEMNAETIHPWHDMECCEGELSNFDRTIDDGVEEALRTKEKYAQYSAWNFCGHVWFDGEQFKCDVWRYKQSVDVIAAPTLPQLMDAVSDEYGYD